MKKNIKMWVIVAGALVLGTSGFLWLNGVGKDTITYRTERVDRGDIIVAVNATGTLNAVTTVQVGTQVSGTIAKLYADFNSMVKEGQLLAQLDPTFLQAAVEEQKANKDRATAQVNESQRNFNRISDLFSKSLVSQAEMDAATTALESARATLKQVAASLDRALVNLRYATIRAPISGIVISRDVDVGQTVAASLQAPTLFTIANDLRKMQVEASVDEADIGNVKVGQHVTFRVDAFPDKEFEGIVSQIRLKPIVNQNVVTYIVVISVDNPEQKLMPGMTATVSIEVAKRENVMRVPLLALRFTPPQEVLDEIKKEEEKAPRTDTSAAQEATQRRGGWDQNARGERSAGRGWEQGGSRRQGEGGVERGQMRRQMSMARVWTLEGKNLRSIMVRKGIQDSRFAEVVGEHLSEGSEVIVGSIGGPTQVASGQGQTNPFMPQMPRGSRRGF